MQMMSSRERVKLSVEHKEPDRIPLDLGGSSVTGMHVSTVYLLRQDRGNLRDGLFERFGNDFTVLHPVLHLLLFLWNTRMLFGRNITMAFPYLFWTTFFRPSL
jgi:hypothetical protein